MDAVNGNGLSDGQKPFRQSCFPELPKLPSKLNDFDFNLDTYFPAKVELGGELPSLPMKLNDSSDDFNLGTYSPAKMIGSSGDLNFGTYFPAKAELGRDLPEFPTILTDYLVPSTPDCARENGGNGHYFASPVYCLPRPLSFSSPQDDQNPVASNGDSPRTPKDSVFDPFAPGPDHLMLAPRYQKKQLKFEESLNFLRCSDHNDNNSNEALCFEEMLFKTVCNDLLEDIVSEQKEELLAGYTNYISSGDRTPTSAPLLSGIAETCPAVPKKPTTKFRNVDRSLCKRLEF